LIKPLQSVCGATKNSGVKLIDLITVCNAWFVYKPPAQLLTAPVQRSPAWPTRAAGNTGELARPRHRHLGNYYLLIWAFTSFIDLYSSFHNVIFRTCFKTYRRSTTYIYNVCVFGVC